MAQVSNLEAVFVVDESGSMEGEHAFLQTFVPSFDQQMGGQGISGLYGLVGYGRSDPAAHSIPVGGNLFGTAQEFVIAAQTLETSGGTEDGYEALDFALTNYPFTPGAATSRVVVLVTDEDRDDIDSSITLATVQQLLADNDVSWNAILDQAITDQEGNTAVGAAADRTFIDVDGDGIPELSSPPVLGAAEDNTTEQYTTPILAGGACIADLNILRAGGAGADAFAEALARCLITVVTGGGGEQPLLNPIPVNAMLLTDQHFSDIMMRLHGRLQSTDDHPVMAAPSLAPVAQSALGGLALSGGSGSPVMISAAADLPPIVTEARFGSVRVFLNASGHFTDADRTADQPGFDQTAGTLTVGADTDLAANMLVGAALGFADASAEADGSDSELDTRMLSGYLYGAARLGERGYLNAAVSYGRLNYDLKREFGAEFATGDTDANQFAAFAELGMDLPLASSDVILTPSVGTRYVNLDVDGFTDSGGLEFADQDYDVLTAIAKLKGAMVIPQAWGYLLPEMTVAGTYDVDKIEETVGVGGNQIRVGDVGRFNLIVNPAIAATTFAAGMTARVEYKATLNDDFTDHAFIGRVRIPLN